MLDDVERGQERQAEFNADSLRDHRQRQKLGAGLTHCEECGEPIPDARRRAQPTATHCVGCLTAIEINQRRSR